MSVLISFLMGTYYSLYKLNYLGSNHEKYCLVNQIEYHPYAYTN
jgi:hypothetical protein